MLGLSVCYSLGFGVIFFFIYIPDINAKVIDIVVCACIQFQVNKFFAWLALQLYLLAFKFVK